MNREEQARLDAIEERKRKAMERERKRREIGSKPTKTEWGKHTDDYYGYGSEEERRDLRGLEDWEMVEQMAQSRKPVPKWFFVVVGIVLLAAFGLSLPFWCDRPDHARHWITWGHLMAVVYLLVAGGFIYLMINVFNPEVTDEEECDPSHDARKDKNGAGK
jgi:hypothetical protein